MSNNQMIINYVPGDECRAAIVEDGKLEELHAEKFTAASRVGNIYVGRVTNVEASIQAAFVDFGVEDNGFLHYSDLHPRYFPGENEEETTERVGHKTPRRERPPIQHCLRRGQEVVVQVLKEGVGTKGPTLTSYLSIPGRFLVMMPFMDKVGVSRKVEDEEQRHKMREILDQLELPEGFGFILRTAGMDRNKTELKRDLAYLQRLWKDMERRLNTGTKPRLLYSESDLLVRCLRDQLSTEINEVVIDNELALERASRFMKIVAPRSQTRLLHFPGKAPIFHAFGIEQQIATIHAREVPLPSGGRLVIDQTEALVAIDVNSGKARDARDAETNAYRTNLEAVDEICRQLRLRDMGGIIVNDLIDMRHASHRKEIETRFKERLKRDKARTTTAPISLFGILEMTRQRMRGSHESVHFVDCPICRGRGLVQRPESVAADALRELAAILDIERVAKVELVVAPRVAGELLSSKRRVLSRIERTSGKHVDVRVSETVPIDRVSFYAYDPSGADIDVVNLPSSRKPADLKEWEYRPKEGEEGWASDAQDEADAARQAENAEPEEQPEPHPIELLEPGIGPNDQEIESGAIGAGAPSQNGEEGQGGRRRRRRGRRGRGGQGGQGPDQPRGQDQRHAQSQSRGQAQRPPAPAPHDQQPFQPAEGSGEFAPSGPVDGTVGGEAFDGGEQQAPGGGPEGQMEIGPDGLPRRKRRRRRRRGRGRGSQGGVAGQPGMMPGAPQNGSPDGQFMDGPGAPAPGDFDEAGPAAEVGGPGEVANTGGYRNPLREPQAGADQGEPAGDGQAFDQPGPPGEDGAPGAPGGRRRRRRRGRRGGGGGGGGAGPSSAGGPPLSVPQAAPAGGPARGQPGGRGRGGDNSRSSPPPPRAAQPPAPKAPPAAPEGKPVRSLYAAARRKLSSSELNKRPKPE